MIALNVDFSQFIFNDSFGMIHEFYASETDTILYVSFPLKNRCHKSLSSCLQLFLEEYDLTKEHSKEAYTFASHCFPCLS